MATAIAPPSTYLASLEARIAPLRARLAEHSLYASLGTLDDLHRFMQAHVFAVWDFMSLLKSLQRGLTSVEVPWLPSAQPEARRLVNEIVLGEESDVFEGRAVSHFELYLEAMRECGADTQPIDQLLGTVRSGTRLEDAIRDIPAPARGFVSDTFALIGNGKLHVTAAAFTFGREDLIPDLFRGFLRDLNHQLDGRLSTFLWYLERHIEVDGEDHGTDGAAHGVCSLWRRRAKVGRSGGRGGVRACIAAAALGCARVGAQGTSFRKRCHPERSEGPELVFAPCGPRGQPQILHYVQDDNAICTFRMTASLGRDYSPSASFLCRTSNMAPLSRYSSAGS